LLELLQKLDGETELALRVALNRLSWKCRANEDWSHRIIELRKAVARRRGEGGAEHLIAVTIPALQSRSVVAMGLNPDTHLSMAPGFSEAHGHGRVIRIGARTIDRDAKNSKCDLQKYESDNRPRRLFLDANGGYQAETNPSMRVGGAPDKLAKRTPLNVGLVHPQRPISRSWFLCLRREISFDEAADRFGLGFDALLESILLDGLAVSADVATIMLSGLLMFFGRDMALASYKL
jgi:hypothetical protein